MIFKNLKKGLTKSSVFRLIADDTQYGRSMIEMLGVLAIIGVLSVGGLAGYSKAIEMWKISRQKQQIAELFMQCINLKDDFLREYNRTVKAVPTAAIMDAMGVIPDGMNRKTNPTTFMPLIIRIHKTSHINRKIKRCQNQEK